MKGLGTLGCSDSSLVAEARREKQTDPFESREELLALYRASTRLLHAPY